MARRSTRNNIPAKDDICVTRLRAAGAIVVGKTTLPEFAHKGMTDGPGFRYHAQSLGPDADAGDRAVRRAASVAAGG